jgi:hypothetical protein
MIKYLDYYPGDEGVEISLIHPGVLEKTASYDPELQEFLQKLLPDPKRYFLLVNALGAGEFYGSNRNGDYFPEPALVEHHKTFETLGRVYRHHRNKPKLGHRIYGEILYSHYNHKMHRVELVIGLDINAAPDLKEKIDKGEFPPISMGSRVPYDECSICGNRAPRIQDYCEHAKTMMNKILSDGRKVYVINTKPKFFDISFVHVPADRTAYTLRKVASDSSIIIPSAIKTAEELKDAGIKEADIIKMVEGEVDNAGSDPSRLIVDSQPDMPAKMVDDLAGSAPLNEVLSTLVAMRVMPKKQDFQKLVLTANGQKNLAEELEREKVSFIIHDDVEPIIPNDIGCNYFSEKVACVLQKYPEYLERAPLTKPVVMARVLEKYAIFEMGHQKGSKMEQAGIVPPYKTGMSHQKGSKMEQAGIVPPLKDMPDDKMVTQSAEQVPIILPIKNPLLPLTAIGGLYYGLSRLMNSVGQAEGVRALIARNPWLLPIIIGGATIGTMEIQKKFLEKTAAGVGFLSSMLLSVPATYLYAGYQEAKVRKREPIGSYADFVRKNPLLSSIGHGFLGSKASKLLTKVGEAKDKIFQASLELNEEKFGNLYNIVIDSN